MAQVAPFSGPLAANGEANWQGANVYFARINSQGGINGSTIRFVREDDGYVDKETVRLVEQVIARDKPLAFINLLGSANVKLLMEKGSLELASVPAVGVTPGADSLRQPGSGQIFHLQASDRTQIDKILTHLSTIGLRKIGVVFQDNPFGRSGAGFVDELAKEKSLTVVRMPPMALGSNDAKDIAKALRDGGAQCYLMILAPNSASALVRDVRALTDKTPIYGLSYAAAEGIVREAGVDGASGVALAQILPNPLVPTTRVAAEYLADLKRFGPENAKPSSLSFVGYVAARVVVEGIRKAGAAPTPAKVTAALRSTRRFDLGGYRIDFSNGPSSGSAFVDIAVIDRTGRLRY